MDVNSFSVWKTLVIQRLTIYSNTFRTRNTVIVTSCHSSGFSFNLASLSFVGLVTQCVSIEKIARRPNLNMYCDNLLLSINAKLSGANKVVKTAITNNDTTIMFLLLM
jgi:hypothetical protein